MSAPTVKKQAKTVRGKIKEKVTVKNVLFTPYSVEWPMLPVGETQKILQEIQRVFEPYRVSPDSKKRRMMGTKYSEKKWTPDSLQRFEEAKKLKAELRCHTVFGVNSTTKCLERDELELIMICRSAKPPILTSHLMTLAACRGVPALALSGLSETLSKMLNARAVIAVGFMKRKESQPNAELYKLADLIKQKTPPLEIPWLKYKDVSLEELSHKVKEASEKRNIRKGGTGSKREQTVESSKGQQALLGKRKSENIDSDTKQDLNPGPAKKARTEGQFQAETIMDNSDKVVKMEVPLKGEMFTDDSERSKVNTGELERSKGKGQATKKVERSVSKVVHQSGEVYPIRSMPKEMKADWKKRNKKKKNKEKR